MYFALSFLNPWLLAGLLGLSIPIIIHLLFKRRKKRIRFSTLRFLKIATRENARRMKLRQLLLLLMRLCIIAILVFAFARPFFQDPLSEASATGGKEIIFLIDTSCSMRAENGMGQVRMDYAKERAAEIVENLGEGNLVGVMEFSQEPRILLPLSDDPAAAKSAISTIEPNHDPTNFLAAVDAAQKEFDWGSKRPKEIVLISDLQKTGFAETADFKLNSAVNLRVVAVSDDVANYGFTDVGSDSSFHQPGKQYHLLGNLQNFSRKEFPEVSVETFVEGKRIFASTVDVKPEISRAFEAQYHFPATGSYRVEFRVDTKDAFPTDNVRYHAVDVRMPVKVLCVNGTPTTVRYLRETIYLEVALNPAEMGEGKGDTIFSPRVVNPEDLASINLSDYAAIVFANVRSLRSDVIERVDAYVRRGGGLIWFLGDEVSVPRYNEYLYAKGSGVFPAMLVKEEGDTTDIENYWTVSDFDEDHFITGLFTDPTKGDLSVARYYRRFDIGGLEEAEARAIMHFSDGRPAVVEKKLGEGRIIMATSTADEAWTDLPRRKIFLPFIHRCMLYVTNISDDQTGSNGFKVGESVRLDEKAVSVEKPGGAKSDVSDTGVFSDTDVPGIYRQIDKRGKTISAFSVNIDPVESDLSQYTAEDIRSIILGTRAGIPGGGQQAGPTSNREIWAYLLIALLILLLGEVWLANHTPA